MQSTANTNTQIPAGLIDYTQGRTFREQPPFLNAYHKTLEAGIWGVEVVRKNLGSNFDYNQKYHSTINFFNSQRSTLDVEGVSYYDSDDSDNFNTYPAQLRGNIVLMGRETYPNNIAYKFVGRMWLARISQADKLIFDGVPVLDADGTPCMYDKISKQCFYNAGTGTFGYRIKTSGETVAPFARRDPYYTAPSGVYARLIAENELDIIADTDMQDGEEQGYTWFANTGEAYEHFGIVQEEELLTTNNNDND